jgi:hypothetical protein
VRYLDAKTFPSQGPSVSFMPLDRLTIGSLMINLDSAPGRDDEDIHFTTKHVILRQLPFLAILALAIAGVAYTNFSGKPLIGYWEFLALAIAAVCIVSEWTEMDDRQARLRLVWTQAIHWTAVLVTMNIMLLSGVQQLLPAPATSLVLLILLALGTFLAGLNLMSMQIGFLGLSMALAVPAISWIKQSALFLILVLVFLIGLAMAFWSLWGDMRRPQRKTTLHANAPPDAIGDSEDADLNAARRRLGLDGG